MVSILCIDDEPDTHDYFNMILPFNCRLDSIRDQAGLEDIHTYEPDLVFLDIDFCQGTGRALLAQIRAWLHPVPIIVHSHTQVISEVVQCLREGAADYIPKPITRQCLLAKLGTLKLFGNVATSFCNELQTIVGLGKTACSFRHILANFNTPGSCCLVSAADGVGKYPVAQALHKSPFSGPLTSSRGELRDCFRSWSPRGKTSLTQEQDLFGNTAGMSSGGILEGLDGGTLLLEDLEHLDQAVQLRIARMLNRGQIALGNQRTDVPIRIRLVAATSMTPLDLKRDDRIVADLLRQLFPFRLVLPGLRHRRSEIPALAWYYFQQNIEAFPGLKCQRIAASAMDKLSVYAWPGNLMELRESIREACLRAQSIELQAEDIFFSHGTI